MSDEQDRVALRTITEVCRYRQVQWMLIGALAREIQLVENAGISPGRATDDIDIAVLVESWEEFDELRQAFISTGRFAATNLIHRLRSEPAGGIVGRNLDLVPFGALQSNNADDQAVIRWPPDASVIMSVVGFEEALQASMVHHVDDFSIRIASVPGLAILKLIAWLDRGRETAKDAADFEMILVNYEHVIGSNRYFDDESDAAEAFKFDVATTCAWLLGVDMRAIATASTSTSLERALTADIHFDMPGSQHHAKELRRLLDVCLGGLKNTLP